MKNGSSKVDGLKENLIKKNDDVINEETIKFLDQSSQDNNWDEEQTTSSLSSEDNFQMRMNSFDTNSTLLGDAVNGKSKIWKFIKQSSIQHADLHFPELSEAEIITYLKNVFSFWLLQKILVFLSINYFTIQNG